MHYLNLAGYLAIPLAFAVHFWIGHDKSWEPIATFLLASLGVVPLANLMGQSTEHLSAKTGPTWGGLLNATFGNAAELIIGVIALTKGLNEIVKASLTGSILGNLLLVGGAAMTAGGWRYESQKFNRNAAETNAGLLVLAVAAMLFPAIFHFTLKQMHDTELAIHEHRFSMTASVILLVVYALGLLFTLRTHAHIFSCGHEDDEAPKASHSGGGESWSVKRSVLMLLLASVGIAIVAELLVGSAELMARRLGWNHVFVGVILLAIIGNAAEHSTAVMLALRNDMNTAMTITYQSSLQIALFATPFLVLLSALMVGTGWFGEARHLDLMFSPMEVVAVFLSVIIVIILAMNGQTNWFEGVMLLAVYVILGIGFFFMPAESHATGDAAPNAPVSTPAAVLYPPAAPNDV